MDKEWPLSPFSYFCLDLVEEEIRGRDGKPCCRGKGMYCPLLASEIKGVINWLFPKEFLATTLELSFHSQEQEYLQDS